MQLEPDRSKGPKSIRTLQGDVHYLGDLTHYVPTNVWFYTIEPHWLLSPNLLSTLQAIAPLYEDNAVPTAPTHPKQDTIVGNSACLGSQIPREMRLPGMMMVKADPSKLANENRAGVHRADNTVSE